jgi:hypothetical protein
MLLGDDHALVVPVERCLAYLTSIERSANTIKGYAAPQGLVRLARLDPIAVAIGPRQATGSGHCVGAASP